MLSGNRRLVADLFPILAVSSLWDVCKSFHFFIKDKITRYLCDVAVHYEFLNKYLLEKVNLVFYFTDFENKVYITRSKSRR